MRQRCRQARGKKGEKAPSLTEEIALGKVGLGNIERGESRRFRPQNESATCMYERVASGSHQHREKGMRGRGESGTVRTAKNLKAVQTKKS